MATLHEAATSLKNIIFDLDGVLIDSEQTHLRAKKATIAKFGITLPAEVYPQFVGKTDEMFFSHLIENFPCAETKFDDFIQSKREEYARLVSTDGLHPIKGAVEFMQLAVERDLRIGVVTSSDDFYLGIALKSLGIADWISVIVNANHVTKHKPHPEPYLKAREQLGSSGCDTIVIEDSPSGVRAAKGAELFTFGLGTTFASKVLVDAGADCYVKNFEEMRARLEWPRH